MADLTVYVHLMETRTGDWCPACFLPSAITIITGISMQQDEKPGPLAPTMTKTWCPDCGWDPALTDGDAHDR